MAFLPSGFPFSNSPLSLLIHLRHQRHTLSEIVLHHGADLVLNLHVARDFPRWQRLTQFGRVSAFQIGLGLIDRHRLIDEFFRLVIGQRFALEVSCRALL